jgi:hypothetical protein
VRQHVRERERGRERGERGVEAAMLGPHLL